MVHCYIWYTAGNESPFNHLYCPWQIQGNLRGKKWQYYHNEIKILKFQLSLKFQLVKEHCLWQKYRTMFRKSDY